MVRATLRSCARHGLAYLDMRLQALKDLIKTKTFEAMKKAIASSKKSAGAGIGTDRYFIDLWVTERGYVEAVITHYSDIKKDSKNLEAWCEDVLRGLSWAKARKAADA